mmetsp:Transcript_1452/g.5010  ORF Transcript_1452/g.5010 Transcript_1452/m.5010 type:complete len:142 (-) Transcript_1452:234-659(-)
MAEEVLRAAAAGGFVGSVAGAVRATWVDASAVERGNSAAALAKVTRLIASHALIFAATGAAFVAGDKMSEALAGKRDLFTAVPGAFAAGGVLGTAARSLPVALGAGALISGSVVALELAGPKAWGLGKESPKYDPSKQVAT